MNQQDFDALLEDISDSLLRDDFALWERRVLLPFTVVNQAGPTTMETREDLLENFHLYLSACKTMELDTIFRTSQSIDDCGDGTFIGTYRTELLSSGTRRTDPYVSSTLVTHADDNWRMISILNARGHHGWTGHQPHQTGDHK